eukprot:4968634-Pleurochrysis_carterae.AAC.1
MRARLCARFRACVSDGFRALFDLGAKSFRFVLRRGCRRAGAWLSAALCLLAALVALCWRPGQAATALNRSYARTRLHTHACAARRSTHAHEQLPTLSSLVRALLPTSPFTLSLASLFLHPRSLSFRSFSPVHPFTLHLSFFSFGKWPCRSSERARA